MRRSASLILPLAAAAYGLGCAIAFSTLTIGPPHPGQLPGAMLLRGLDARTPMRMMLLAMVMPFAAALVLTPQLRRFENGLRWARVAAAISLASGLWAATVDPSNLIAVVLVPLVLAAAAFLLRTVDAGFTRRDLILIPSAVALFASLEPWPVAVAVPLAATVIVAIRVAVVSLKPRVDPAYAFAMAPAALVLDVHAWFPDAFEFVAIAVVIVSPFVLAPTLRRPPRRVITRVVYPLFALSLMASVSLLSAERAPRLDLFEDGHWLMPANEMLHGAKPFQDIVPGHGLINDGLLDYFVMRLGANNAGQVLFVRQSLAVLLAPALFAIALALTGSAEAAVLAVIAAAGMQLTGTSIPGTVSVLESNAHIRTLPSMFALACCIAAVRRRQRWPLWIAGALAVVALITSVDFGAYSLIVIAVTLVRIAPPQRRSALVYASAGFGGAAVVVATGMAVAGFLGSFIRVTFFEIPRLTEAYALQFFYWPPQNEAILGVPDALGGLFYSRVVWIVVWVLVAIATAALLSATRGPDALADPMIVAGSWVVLCAISFGERAHAVFMPVAIAIAIAAIYAVRRSRLAFATAAFVMATACTPTQFLLHAHSRLTWKGSMDPILVRYDALPHTHGAWIDGRNAHRMAIVQAVAARTLRPDDTFFDFSNMPGLFYALDRRCPVRMYEVPFYETEALQREVIAQIERNPHVRLALMQFTNRDENWIDNVPNGVRAPLVDAWLREHFRPLIDRDGVALWIRR